MKESDIFEGTGGEPALVDSFEAKLIISGESRTSDSICMPGDTETVKIATKPVKIATKPVKIATKPAQTLRRRKPVTKQPSICRSLTESCVYNNNRCICRVGKHMQPPGPFVYTREQSKNNSTFPIIYIQHLIKHERETPMKEQSMEIAQYLQYIERNDPDGVAVTDERDLPMDRLSIPGSESDILDGKNASDASQCLSNRVRRLSNMDHKPPTTNHRFKVEKTDLNHDGLYSIDCKSQPDLSVKRKDVTRGSENGGITTGRVGSWATDFDKLLSDPAGLQTFAEFLKKEFSHENIYFWCACQKYSETEDGEERMKVAEAVMERHLDVGALEPVNIDSVARSTTRETLAKASSQNPPDKNILMAAQKQIYNLMKFDSFPRFLKSDVYKECMLADLAAKPLPFNGIRGLDEELIISPETKSVLLVAQEDGKIRRKSLLQSLVRVKRNRSKSKDRPDAPEQKLSTAFFRPKKPSQFLVSPLSSRKTDNTKDEKSGNNRLSLTTEELMKLGGGGSGAVKLGSGAVKMGGGEEGSSEASEVCPGDGQDSCVLARVTLPDKATTVVNTNTGENIRQLVNRLLEKRGLLYPCFDVLMAGKEKPLDLSEDCSVLGCSELRVEPRILFRLELPSRRSIGVKSKPDKMIEDVLCPILQQYGWTLDNVLVTVVGKDGISQQVDLFNTIAGLDNTTITVTQKYTSTI